MTIRSEAATTLPTASDARKGVPLCAGVLDYFPAALAEVAKVSKAGNDKHNPGEPLHHARGKSMDHADCIARHLLERGTVDPSDGLTHTAHLAWRALAMLQEELEAAGAPLARGAQVVTATEVSRSDAEQCLLFHQRHRLIRGNGNNCGTRCPVCNGLCGTPFVRMPA